MTSLWRASELGVNFYLKSDTFATTLRVCLSIRLLCIDQPSGGSTSN